METISGYKRELINILIEINRLVTEHLKVQKSIFEPSIRKKLIFQKNDFESLYETNKKIQTELYQVISKMHKEKKELNVDPFIYGGIKDYALLFHASSEKLTRIIFELNLKAKKQNNLTEDEFNQLVDEHKKIDNSRMQKGNTIQRIAILLAQ